MPSWRNPSLRLQPKNNDLPDIVQLYANVFSINRGQVSDDNFQRQIVSSYELFQIK